MGCKEQGMRERDPSCSKLDALDPEGQVYSKAPRTSIPYRMPIRAYEFYGFAFPAPRTPRHRALWQLLAVATVVLVLIQALSCGLVFCVSLPAGRNSYIDLREVFTEFRMSNVLQGGLAGPSRGSSAEPAPMLIPRIIHQTYRSRQVPPALKSVMQSWTRVNGPAWQARFYDDDACIDFVRREFPEYVDAYLSLPKDVERSDFFRYMVILRLGGVYADIDVELRQPLDAVMGPTDTMVVGWEAEVPTDAAAFKRHFVRKRQVLQWFFAATPGHPVLRAACEHIARNARRTFSNNTNRDTLERTGPGMWTDVVLRHAATHPPTKVDDPWKVRILPRVAFGVHPTGGEQGLTPDAKEIVVLHHFLGSWKKRGGWHKRRTVPQILAEAVVMALHRHSEAASAEEPITPSVISLFPVSAAFTPPFTVMTHLIGQGDMQSGSDVSAVLTSWGTWQAAMSRPNRRPLVVDALVGSLGPPEQGGVLVDVSAGVGFFSLAAAARGHTVVAFESSARSLDAFSAGIRYNGFADRIRLYNVSLGAVPSAVCLQRRAGAGAGAGGEGAAAAAAGHAGGEEVNDAAAAATRRGYGDPALHGTPAAECASLSQRQTLSHMLMGSEAAAAAGGSGGAEAVQQQAADAAPSLASRVGALRLSAHGWEGWVLDGAQAWLDVHRPGVVLLEYSPQLVARSGYPGGGLALLRKLHELGYVHMAHAGYVCDKRWFQISRALRAGGTALGAAEGGEGVAAGAAGKGAGAAAAAGGAEAGGAAAGAAGGSQLPNQPTWCKLTPELFQMLTTSAHPEVAENVLLIHASHISVRGGEEVAAGGPGPAAGAGSAALVASSDVTPESQAGLAAAGAAGGGQRGLSAGLQGLPAAVDVEAAGGLEPLGGAVGTAATAAATVDVQARLQAVRAATEGPNVVAAAMVQAAAGLQAQGAGAGGGRAVAAGSGAELRAAGLRGAAAGGGRSGGGAGGGASNGGAASSNDGGSAELQ